VDEVARRLSLHADQPRVYAYQFLWGAGGDTGQSVLPDPWGFKLGSCHTLEIPFLFDNDEVNVALQLLVFTPDNKTSRKALTRAMMAYTASFARTGDPNGPGTGGLPRWEPWTSGEGAPKCILWDADKTGTLHIEMSQQELTEAGVRACMAREVPEPLYTEAKEYLDW
jgi:para-nitrobenzyl esterase